MHDYLRAIGFSSIQTKTEFENILKDIEQNPQMDFITDDGVKPVLGEKSIDFGENIGINVRGEYDEQGEFCRDYYNHLKEMVYQMLNFSNLKELFSALNGVDTEALDRLTKEVNETRTNIDPSIIANLAKVVDFVDPMTATVKNSIHENVAKAVEEYKKQKKNQ